MQPGKSTKKKVPQSGIVSNITYVKSKAKENESDNWHFRSMLKASDIPSCDIDNLAIGIYNDLIQKIDCTQCGNCCSEITPVLTKTDISKLSKHLNMTESEITRRYLKIFEGKTVFKTKPCPFLKDKKCSLYEARPHDCRAYPHLHKKHIRSRFTNIFSHIGICPIIFNFYEEMKRELFHKLDPQQITWL